MIINVFSILSLFLAGVGSALAAVAATIGAWGWLALGRRPDPARQQVIEERCHLLALVIGVLGLVRLLAWPHFYWLLKSYVAELSIFGVMCVYGVTRIHPHLVLMLQATKPLVLLSVGLWWLLGLVDRRTRSAPLLGARMWSAVPLAGLAVLECSAEALYVIREKVGHRITCCTQFLDTQAAWGVGVPGLPPGFRTGSPLVTLAAYFACNALVAGISLHLGRRVSPSDHKRGFLWLAGAAVCGLANMAVTQWAWSGALAPRVLGLPYHHCVYEILTDTPGLGFAAVMALAGNACLLWPLVLEHYRASAPEAIAGLQSWVYKLCAVALASELLVVGIHLV